MKAFAEASDTEILALGASPEAVAAIRAGLIASDFDPTTGAYAPAIEYSVPSVFDVPASQRNARIAPAIAVKFRYAGPVHYTSINYTTTTSSRTVPKGWR